MTNVPGPLLEARLVLEPVFRAAGYRFVGVEAFGEGGRSGTAEYRTSSRRLRIVYEGDEDALWIDSAAERDAQIISSWTDIEWSLSGQRLPVVKGSSIARLETLVDAAARFLA